LKKTRKGFEVKKEKERGYPFRPKRQILFMAFELEEKLRLRIGQKSRNN
jgi:hypothetical protein